MPRCRECGYAGRPAALFCTQCGASIPVVTPVPPVSPALPTAQTTAPAPVRTPVRRSAAWGLRGLGAGAAVLLSVLLITVMSHGTASNSASPPRPAAPPIVVASEPATTMPPQITNPPVDPRPGLSDPAAAKAALDAEVMADRQAVEALVGSWVPQLSAKRPGLVANGITYDHVEILRDFRSLKARYPDVKLIWSGDFSSFKFGNFWITVKPLPYPDGQSANAWCDGQSIAHDDCYAKLLSHSKPYEGATLLRPR